MSKIYLSTIKNLGVNINFIGTSSDQSIPREGCSCPQCNSTDPKDRRLRSAALFDRKILIDAGPDIKKQLRSNQIQNLEAVLITHEHQDHVGGIKDLLRIRHDIRIIRLKPGQHFKLLNIDFHAFKIIHSNIIPTVGVVAGDLVYIPDSANLNTALKYLEEVKVAILDGSVLGKNFGGHLPIEEIIAQVKEFKNLKKIYFTHNGHTRKTHKEMNKLVQQIGDERFHLAYDGLEIKV